MSMGKVKAAGVLAAAVAVSVLLARSALPRGVDRDGIHADTVRRALQFFQVALKPKSG